MKTSYFAKTRDNPNGVAITSSKPSWFKGRWYSKLAPPENLVIKYKKGFITEEEYTKVYLPLIKSRVHPKDVLSDLGSDAILLCYEGPDKFCHRHLVSKWLRENGIDIEEMLEDIYYYVCIVPKANKTYRFRYRKRERITFKNEVKSNVSWMNLNLPLHIKTDSTVIFDPITKEIFKDVFNEAEKIIETYREEDFPILDSWKEIFPEVVESIRLTVEAVEKIANRHK